MRTFSILTCAVLTGCVPSPWQTTPPQLLAAVLSSDGAELALEFDKPVQTATVGGEAVSAKIQGNRVTAAVRKGLTAGKRYGWSAEVNDEQGNVTSVAGRFYGANDHAASLRLNEVRIAGAGDHTDFVELRAESGGSLGGWTIDAYSDADTRQRLVLPDTAVTEGELVVIRYRDKSDTKDAREFRPAQLRGLSATKGLIVLRPSPAAEPSDGLLYSKIPGGGAPLAATAGWRSLEEFDPEHCASTRTWSRTAAGGWILTANGGATPGQPNSSIEWTPSPKKPPKTKSKSRRKRLRASRCGRAARSRPEPPQGRRALAATKRAQCPARAESGPPPHRRKPLRAREDRSPKPSRASRFPLADRPRRVRGTEEG